MYNPEFQGDVCSHKHAFMLDNFIRRLFQNPKRILRPYVKGGDTTVDIGCGPGFFTLELARLVGAGGRVLAVDLQEEMLSKVATKAVLRQMSDIIRPVRCSQTDLNLPAGTRADFILAYYMVHETVDQNAFFNQVKAALNPEGQVLVVEPPFHVSAARFSAMEEAAEKAGFTIKDRPKGKGGKSVLFALAPPPKELQPEVTRS